MVPGDLTSRSDKSPEPPSAGQEARNQARRSFELCCRSVLVQRENEGKDLAEGKEESALRAGIFKA